MEMSKDSLETSNDGEGGRRAESVTDRIYKLVRDMGEDARTLKIADIRERWVSCGQGGDARNGLTHVKINNISGASTKATSQPRLISA